MEKLKLFIFDMDGTLFDTEPISYRIWNEVCGEYGYELPKSLFCSIVGLDNRRISDVFCDYFGDRFPYSEIRSKKVARQLQYYEDNDIPVKQGVRDLLAYAVKEGILCAVASSSPAAQIHMLLNKTCLNSYFSLVQSGENVPCGKPAPDIFLETCRKAGVQPQEALVLEDSGNGILAAAAAHIRAVLVPDAAEVSADIARLAWRQCSTLAEVPQLLQNGCDDGRDCQ